MKNDESNSSSEKTKTEDATWPDFALGLYDKLTGRGSKITYEFDDLDIFLPSKLGKSDHFHWKLNGNLHISTHDNVNKENNE